jgi:REP element-mobilizing transposase RayT
MSLARRVVSNSTYLISRRCLDRMFLLRPDDFIVRTFYYLVGLAAAEYGVLLHGFVCLSNHYHLVLTDPAGVLPLFMERLNGLLARAVNASRGRWECCFSPGSYGMTRLASPEDVLEKVVYVQTNPVTAGLVRRAADWAGAGSVGWRFGETREFPRPAGHFFDPYGLLPENVTLTLAPMPGFEDVPAAAMDALVRERVSAREAELQAESRAAGRAFLGMERVMHFDPEDRPRTREPRRGLNPRVAGKDTAVRVEGIREWSGFLVEYRASWLRWRAGDHGVMFPYGTWLMRVRHHADCRPAPS